MDVCSPLVSFFAASPVELSALLHSPAPASCYAHAPCTPLSSSLSVASSPSPAHVEQQQPQTTTITVASSPLPGHVEQQQQQSQSPVVAVSAPPSVVIPSADSLPVTKELCDAIEKHAAQQYGAGYPSVYAPRDEDANATGPLRFYLLEDNFAPVVASELIRLCVRRRSGTPYPKFAGHRLNTLHAIGAGGFGPLLFGGLAESANAYLIRLISAALVFPVFLFCHLTWTHSRAAREKKRVHRSFTPASAYKWSNTVPDVDERESPFVWCLVRNDLFSNMYCCAHRRKQRLWREELGLRQETYGGHTYYSLGSEQVDAHLVHLLRTVDRMWADITEHALAGVLADVDTEEDDDDDDAAEDAQTRCNNVEARRANAALRTAEFAALHVPQNSMALRALAARMFVVLHSGLTERVRVAYNASFCDTPFVVATTPSAQAGALGVVARLVPQFYASEANCKLMNSRVSSYFILDMLTRDTHARVPRTADVVRAARPLLTARDLGASDEVATCLEQLAAGAEDQLLYVPLAYYLLLARATALLPTRDSGFQCPYTDPLRREELFVAMHLATCSVQASLRARSPRVYMFSGTDATAGFDLRMGCLRDVLELYSYTGRDHVHSRPEQEDDNDGDDSAVRFRCRMGSHLRCSIQYSAARDIKSIEQVIAKGLQKPASMSRQAKKKNKATAALLQPVSRFTDARLASIALSYVLQICERPESDDAMKAVLRTACRYHNEYRPSTAVDTHAFVTQTMALCRQTAQLGFHRKVAITFYFYFYLVFYFCLLLFICFYFFISKIFPGFFASGSWLCLYFFFSTHAFPFFFFVLCLAVLFLFYFVQMQARKRRPADASAQPLKARAVGSDTVPSALHSRNADGPVDSAAAADDYDDTPICSLPEAMQSTAAAAAATADEFWRLAATMLVEPGAASDQSVTEETRLDRALYYTVENLRAMGTPLMCIANAWTSGEAVHFVSTVADKAGAGYALFTQLDKDGAYAARVCELALPEHMGRFFDVGRSGVTSATLQALTSEVQTVRQLRIAPEHTAVIADKHECDKSELQPLFLFLRTGRAVVLPKLHAHDALGDDGIRAVKLSILHDYSAMAEHAIRAALCYQAESDAAVADDDSKQVLLFVLAVYLYKLCHTIITKPSVLGLHTEPEVFRSGNVSLLELYAAKAKAAASSSSHAPKPAPNSLSQYAAPPPRPTAKPVAASPLHTPHFYSDRVPDFLSAPDEYDVEIFAGTVQEDNANLQSAGPKPLAGR
jgi:hypothetical protein